MAKTTTTLYSPAGEKYEAFGAAEVTRLKARGYTDNAPSKPASKSDSK
jgi:hypothetical protein